MAIPAPVRPSLCPLDSCAICLSLPEPSQNSIAVIYAFPASVLKVAVNHTTGRRPLFGNVYIFYLNIKSFD